MNTCFKKIKELRKRNGSVERVCVCVKGKCNKCRLIFIL